MVGHRETVTRLRGQARQLLDAELVPQFKPITLIA